ncbi:MAG: ABC transporter ATP-binding protein [Pirellulales bacterium]|jgi:ABC-type bacteriocin/lantibiotic exporter with double-glycine peptidase domain|nr:ABC transporter ATP-binding protein [Pirellulales bacterium]
MGRSPNTDGHAAHGSHWARLGAILYLERQDVFMILALALGVGLLSIVTPAAIEALVNVVAFGVLLWPVIVLALVMLGFLCFSALLRAMQVLAMEYMQRRIFARTANAFATRFAKAEIESFDGRNPTDIVNRFFEVASEQKALATLLVEGTSVVMITIVGMAVLSFYHPYLLTFGLVMILLIAFLLGVLGLNGISTAIDESYAKFDVAAWLEEIAKCPHTFRFGRGGSVAIDRANQLTTEYIDLRREHFRVVWRQTLFALLLEAIASTVLLGLGGWLVISQQLNLGQLVAGELIVTLVLSALSKSGKYLEIFYDLQASLDKLAVIEELPLEPSGGELLPDSAEPMQVRAEITFKAETPKLLEAAPGERIAIVGEPGCGKSFLLETLALLRVPHRGLLEFDSIDARSLDRAAARLRIALVGQAETFAGTVAENIRVGRNELTASDVREALEMVGLAEQIARLPKGVSSPLASDGLPLSTNELLRLSVARAIAGKPRLLLIDGLLDGLDVADCPKLIASLFERDNPWTLVIVTSREDITSRCDRTVNWS